MRGLILLLFLPYLSAFKSGSTKPNGYILTRFNNLSKYGATRVDCMLQMSSNSLEWVRSLADDIDTTKIAVSSFAGGLRGVKSVGKIISKDIILSVPAEYVLEVTNNKPPTPFPDFVQQDIWEQSLWYQRLAFKLLDLVKNKKDSKMKYWIDQLPKSFSTPLHWDDDSLDKLQYKSVKASVILQKELWKSFYDSWKSSGQNSGNTVSYSEFEWATECVNSRAFSGVYEGSSAAERRKLLLFTGLLTLLWPLLELGSYEQSLTASVAVAISIFIRDVIYSKIAGLKRYVSRLLPTKLNLIVELLIGCLPSG